MGGTCRYTSYQSYHIIYMIMYVYMMGVINQLLTRGNHLVGVAYF